jgi:hypothetical protein
MSGESRHVVVKTVSSTLIGIALLSLLFPLSGCSGAPRTLYGKNIDGQVIDAQSSQPIAGAHVMYLWRSASLTGAIFGESPSEVCYHAAAAVTDSQGHFHIAAWEEPQPYALPNREPTGWAYAPGYVPNYLSPLTGPVREPTVHPDDVFKLSLSGTEGDKRLDELWLAMRDCSYGGPSQRALYPMLKAVYDEAKSVAVTDKQKETVRRFARLVAHVWISPDPTGSANPGEQQIERFIQENLQ